VVDVSTSFVIPVLDEAGTIGDLLDYLQQQFPHSERIVVDGGSRDDTVALAQPACHRLLDSDPGRARQMNAGAAVAAGDYLVFLHADSRPQFSGEDLAAALSGQPLWGFCPVRLDGSARLLRLVEAAMNLRSRLTSVATGDQMLFVRRASFAELGGYADIPLMEDVELSKRLRRLERPRVLRQRVGSSSRRWEQHGILRTILLMWRLRLAYALGARPQKLWDIYYG
jgi:rSAM/selenodomain-associated transferase 2